MKTLAIRDWSMNGFYNMAADICSMKLVEAGGAAAVFRTYTWEPHCLSIGRFQKPELEADLDRLLSHGYHIVRRPTGGRAVWHGDELTYSITAGENHPLVSGSIENSLKKVSGILVSALKSLGIPVEMNERKRELSTEGRRRNPCFTSHGRFEIMTPDGRKLVGSAQARSHGVFIEHGSILFTNQQPLAADYLPGNAGRESRERMRDILENNVGTIRDFSNGVTRKQLANALHSEFAGALSEKPVAFQSAELPGLKRETFERRRIIEILK